MSFMLMHVTGSTFVFPCLMLCNVYAHILLVIPVKVLPDSTCNKLVCLNYSSRSHLEPRGYSEMITHVGVDGLPDSSINCHRMLSSAQPVSVVGTLQKTERYAYPEC